MGILKEKGMKWKEIWERLKIAFWETLRMW